MMTLRTMANAILYGVLTISASPATASEKDWEPLFPRAEAFPPLPLMERVLFDVPLTHSIANGDEWQSAYVEAERLDADGSNASAVKLQDIFQRHQSLLQFASLNFAAEDERFVTLKRKSLANAKRLLPVSTSREEKSLVHYYIVAHNFLSGQYGEVSSSTTRAKDFPSGGEFRTRVIIMRALSDLDSERKKSSITALLKAAAQLEAEQRVPLYLAITRIYAGLNSGGHGIATASKNYRVYLKKAASFSLSLDDVSKNSVMAYIDSLLGATDDRSYWDELSLPESSFAYLPAWSSVEEGKALASLAAGRVDEGLLIYKKLAKHHKDSPLMAQIDGRILDALEYQEATNKDDAYDKMLVVTERKYRRLAASSTEKSNFNEAAIALRARLQTRVAQQTEKCLTSDTDAKNICPHVIKLGRALQASSKDRSEKISLTAQMAAMEQHSGNYRAAVKLFLGLSRSTKGSESEKHLQSALKAQRILAGWPEELPWSRKPLSTKNTDLTGLAKIYSLALAKSRSWENAAPLALVLYVNGDQSAAFKIWDEWMTSRPGEMGMDLAAGIVLSAHHEQKNWQEVVRVTKLCLQKNLTARIENGSIDLAAYLAEGLFQGGLNSLENKKYAQSVSLLEEFTKNYPTDSRHAEAMFTLAQGYHFTGNDQSSVGILKAYIDAYPKDRNVAAALSYGMNWARTDKVGIFFHEKFIADFPDDPEVPRHRENLIKIAMKHQVYGSAAEANKAKSLDERTSEDEKLKAAWQYLLIEDKYGDLKRALWGATRVIDLSKVESPALADALGVLARYSAKYTKYDRLEFFEKKIENFEFSDPHVRKNLAEVRLLIAKRSAAKPLPQIQNIALKKPEATMVEQYGVYSRLRNNFRKVCAVSDEETCQEATFLLSKVSLRSFAQIEAIKIPDTLDEASVKAFDAKKQKLLADIKASILEEQLAGIQASP